MYAMSTNASSGRTVPCELSQSIAIEDVGFLSLTLPKPQWSDCVQTHQTRFDPRSRRSQPSFASALVMLRSHIAGRAFEQPNNPTRYETWSAETGPIGAEAGFSGSSNTVNRDEP